MNRTHYLLLLLLGSLTAAGRTDAPAPQPPVGTEAAQPDTTSDVPPDANQQPSAAATPAQSSGDLSEMSLEELMNVQVSTVSRVDERIDEAPGSVYVYPRSVIQQRGYRSLGELLQTVPGFTVFHRDLQFVAGVRGLNANDNDKITLLING